MNINLLFLFKLNSINIFFRKTNPIVHFLINVNNLKISSKPKKLQTDFLKKSIILLKSSRVLKKNKTLTLFFFLNKFFINFLEFFFKTKILFNLKKGSNKLILKQISSRKFLNKYFKKNLNVSKQILGVIYYSLLLKDSSIFVNFFKKIVEKLNIKLHKKVFLGFRKLIKDVYFNMFSYLGLLGVFFNIKGKIGVSGSAKKRRYFFYYGKHSITNRQIKIDLKTDQIWTFTGTLGFSFLIFF